MNQIKKFIDRVSYMESNGQLSVMLPATEARLLRDEISKLLADMISTEPAQTAESTAVIRGGRW